MIDNFAGMGTGDPDCNDVVFSVDVGDGTIDYTDTNNTNSNGGAIFIYGFLLHCVRIVIFFFFVVLFLMVVL